MLSGFLVALHEVASWNAVFSMVLGMLIGYALGSVPGLTSSIGIALIVPFTFTMSPVWRIARLPPTADSGDAFRIEGLSDVPLCRPSPMQGSIP